MWVSRGSVYCELRELHLQARFAGARAPREDGQDQLRAVDHAPPDEPLKIRISHVS